MQNLDKVGFRGHPSNLCNLRMIVAMESSNSKRSVVLNQHKIRTRRWGMPETNFGTFTLKFPYFLQNRRRKWTGKQKGQRKFHFHKYCCTNRWEEIHHQLSMTRRGIKHLGCVGLSYVFAMKGFVKCQDCCTVYQWLHSKPRPWSHLPL